MAVKIKDNNNIPRLLKELSAMKKREVHAGILEGGKQAMIAAVHEFGVDITVTPRMRAYLHHIGIHLKQSTTQIRIPERSFIRAGWDNNANKIQKKINDLLPQVMDLNLDVQTFLSMVGLETEGEIKEYLVELSDPPNHPTTIERKGSSNPLVDTGGLVASVSSRVK